MNNYFALKMLLVGDKKTISKNGVVVAGECPRVKVKNVADRFYEVVMYFADELSREIYVTILDKAEAVLVDGANGQIVILY